MLAHPRHPLAGRRRVTIEEVGQQTVIAHNDPSPARERVLRAYERRHAPINIQIALPSLDGIKRAVEMGIGVAVLPRRCALSEIARGQLVAIKVPGLSARRQVRLVFRRGEQSHAAEAFLEIVRATRPAARCRVDAGTRQFQKDGRTAGAPRPLRLLRSDPAAARSRPSCRRETRRAPRRAG